MKQTLNDIMKVVFSLLLGGAILYWMYRGFDFGKVEYVLLHEMDWTWMILSFPFGILAQTFRGWRWKQTLTPLGEHPRDSVSINAIFISYASSLLIPRIGEFARCGVLRRWDNVSFSKSLGTVVTERKTGTSVDAILGKFTATGYLVTIGCALVTGIFGYYLIRKLSIYNKVKDMIAGIWAGITSLRNVKNVPLFIFFTLAIWVSYFLHYYLTFFCFQETSHLSMACALVTFIVGSIAVIVPTPNGAGPWHFAVKTMLILYGVSQNAALYFVLIVHSIQTLLVIVLGIYGWIALQLTARRNEN